MCVHKSDENISFQESYCKCVTVIQYSCIRCTHSRYQSDSIRQLILGLLAISNTGHTMT